MYIKKNKVAVLKQDHIRVRYNVSTHVSIYKVIYNVSIYKVIYNVSIYSNL